MVVRQLSQSLDVQLETQPLRWDMGEVEVSSSHGKSE
jgi:hypothetical protein